MDTFVSDIRFSLRQMFRRKSATLAAILTLALGISANTSMFTLINSMLFKPVTAANPEQLVWISGGDAHRAVSPISYMQYKAVRSGQTSLSGVLAFKPMDLSLGGATPERIRSMVVSGNYFGVLGVKPIAGRAFTADEDSIAGAKPVVVLSYALWRRKFASAPNITDSTIVLNGARYNVVGVAPPEFGGLDFDEPSELFVPLAMLPQLKPSMASLLTDARANWLRVVGRLAPAASIELAQNEISQIARQFDTPTTEPEDKLVLALTRIEGGLDPANKREIAPIMLLLSLVPLLVLLVACANAANMQLAQGLSRRREFAVRRAMGASRSRVVRQLLTESVLLSMMAGLLGVVLSFWLTAGILRLGQAPQFLSSLLTPDPRVLAATTALAMITGIAFGLFPALSATNPALSSSLKEDGGVVVVGKKRRRVRSVLVAGQVAVSLVLVVTAGLFLRSLGKALNVDPGFDTAHTATASFDLGMQGYSADARTVFENGIVERVRALPGVQSAAFAAVLPLSGRMWGTGVRRESDLSDETEIGVGFTSVSNEYFQTIGIPIKQGREFADHDNASSPLVVIVDETLANRLWPGENPVGKRLRLESTKGPLREVVGVASNGHYDSLIEGPRGFLYLPYAQYGSTETSVSLIVRTSVPPQSLLAPIAAEFKQMDRNLPLYRVETLSQSIAAVVDKQRAAASLLGVFGLIALLLAASGMYGVTAHGVRLRTREIGIRMALGSRAADVMRLFVSEGLRLSMVGVGVGLLASAAISRLLSTFLYGLAPTDALTFALGAVVLCVVALIANYVPARRAASVDPLVALRND